MKNISISNQLWKRIRKHRSDLGFKHYTTTMEYITAFYEINQSLLGETNDEIMKKIKEKPKIEYQMDKSERIAYNKLTEDGKEIHRGYGFPDFYHMEDDRLVVDEVKTYKAKLSVNQKRLKEYLVKTGVRYRIWNVDESGNTELVYDSDRGKNSLYSKKRLMEKKQSLLEEKTSKSKKKQSLLLEKTGKKKKNNSDDKMWDI